MAAVLLTQDPLLAAIRELAFARGLDAVADVVRLAARHLTGADGVSFVLRAGDECHYLAENAIGPLWQGRRFPISTCISGWVMLNRAPAIVRDIYQDDRIPHDAYRPTFVKSLAMVPVRRDDPVGAIGLYWASLHTATADQVQIAEVLADAASLAMANARLYEELQQSFERERDAREAAEAASRAKDEWLSIVSHELRTPLTVIQGRAQMLQRGDTEPAAVTRGADAIARNSQLLVKVVDDLLDASHMLTGTLRLRLGSIDVREIVRELLDNARPSASARGIELLLDAGGPLRIIADADRVRQIVWNIVNNAIKFSRNGANVRVAVRVEGNEAVITVADTGLGLEADSIPLIFEKFRQVDGSTTRAQGGLGLGLSIAQRLAQLHGGTITAASDGLGKGSTFTVTLPLRSATEV
jgi:two-component system CheB/CheR fusion protein